MKKSLVLIAGAIALFLVTLAPSTASAGGVRVYVGPGYGYGYRYYRSYPRGYFDYPRRRAWRRWY